MSSNKLHKLLFVVGAGLICSIVLASGHTKKPDQPIMPVLRDISEEAQAWYENLRPRPATPPDIQNPKVLAFTRKFMSGIYLANVEKLGINYELEPVDVGGVEAYWIRVGQQLDGKVLIFFHGGGQILGSTKTNLATALRATTSSGIPVITVEYRLAPEHPFPLRFPMRALLVLGAPNINVVGIRYC